MILYELLPFKSNRDLEEPRKCSGLDVVRYGAETLSNEFGNKFELLETFCT